MPLDSSRILYQDDDLLAVNKLSGELSVKGSGKVQKLPLFDYLKQDFPGLQAIHRLDFETSGVIIFTKTTEAANALKANWSATQKKYITLVMGQLSRNRGSITIPLPPRHQLTSYKSKKKSSSKLIPATTHYKVIDLFANSTYLEATIKTGRHHQIRRHFAAIKHPLVADREYGHGKFNQLFAQEFGYRKFFLHASELSLVHPITGKPLIIKAHIPKPFEAVIKKLRKTQ